MTAYRVWAPYARRVQVCVATGDGPAYVDMVRDEDGWWTGQGLEGDYGFLIDDADSAVPDPRSTWQPGCVHELSRPFDSRAREWRDDGWRGLSIAGGVIYELHVGTFTAEGTLAAAATKLDHLKSIGVTHVELMPVNAFNGDYNWGYDGVGWYAVHDKYGGPLAYQEFVDACHQSGLAVIQDVVYNHLGPSGNYLPRFGPYLTTEGRSTWGEHVNLAEPEVRRYITDNVAFWLEEMHVDALRLDAVHALHDEGEKHILQEMAETRDAVSARTGRRYELIAESDLNDPKLITQLVDGGYGLDAQWSDDFHHALHVALTGETQGYYADFEPLSALAKVLREGFFHADTYSSFRDRVHGVPIDTDSMAAWRLVVSAQNHDQVGNRARGDRITESLSTSELLIAAMLLYVGPFTPMLFMGEEWAASTPFQFFTAHPEPELGKAVAEGRIGEFARMGWDRSVVPDPQDPQTFARSALVWLEADGGRHRQVLEAYGRLARLRADLPDLRDSRFVADLALDEVNRRVRFRRGQTVEVMVNFGNDPWVVGAIDGEIVFATDDRVPGGGDHTIPPRSGVIAVTN